MASLSQSNSPVDENVMDNYADELEDSPADFTPEDERSGGEEEETDDDSISSAEAILMKNKREKGKAKGKHGATGIGGKANAKGKPGRKASWSEDWTNDLVDIICSNDVYQKKLIFTNVKTVRKGEYYYLLTNWLAYLYGRIQSPRPDVMPDRREGITRAAGFVFACIDTQAS